MHALLLIVGGIDLALVVLLFWLVSDLHGFMRDIRDMLETGRKP